MKPPGLLAGHQEKEVKIMTTQEEVIRRKQGFLELDEYLQSISLHCATPLTSFEKALSLWDVS